MTKENENEVVAEAVAETNEVKEETVEVKSKATKKKIIKGVVVNCNLLNVRSAPSLRSNVLDKISKGTEVRIIGDAQNNFYKVYVNNKEGYCVKDYIEVTVNGTQG